MAAGGTHPLRLLFTRGPASAIYGNARAAEVAIALSALSINCFFLGPFHAFSITAEAAYVLTAFVVVSSVMIVQVTTLKARKRNRREKVIAVAISRRGVDANNGTLSVLDVPGEGRIFTIDSPRHGIAEMAGSKGKGGSDKLSRRREFPDPTNAGRDRTQ